MSRSADVYPVSEDFAEKSVRMPVLRDVSTLALALLLCALFLLMNLSIVEDWLTYSFDDGTYSHAFLIPFMSVFLLFQAWRHGQLHLHASRFWLLLLIPTLLLFLWLDLAYQRYPARALVPLCMMLTLLSVYARNRYLLGAAGLYWFVTPIWGLANNFLQWSSVKAVAAIMSFTTIPTFIYGEYVEIPTGTFEIAEGCSGLRYVIAMLALVTFYVALYVRNLRHMLLLTLVALLGAMVTNWLRIVALIIIGHVSEMQNSLVNDHNMFGWFLFFPLMIIVFRYADYLIAGSADKESSDAEAAQRAGRPQGRSPTVWRSAVPTLAVVVVLSGATLRLIQGEFPLRLSAQLDVDEAAPLKIDAPAAPVLYAADRVDVEAIAGEAWLVKARFSGSIDAQRPEFYLNDMVPADWVPEGRRRSGPWTEIQVRRGPDAGLVRYTYGAGGAWMSDKLRLRTARLGAALRLDRSAQLAWIFVPCARTCSEVERSLLDGFLPATL